MGKIGFIYALAMKGKFEYNQIINYYIGRGLRSGGVAYEF